MTTQPAWTDPRTEGGPAPGAESYEHDFVPVIGAPVARRLLATARPARGERVLDVACGTGIVARLAAEAVGDDALVSGLDPNPDMLAVARRAGPGIHWYERPAEDTSLPDGSFDLVTCSMGLQFFADRVGALREMGRVLAPGGRAVICTPGPTPPLMDAIDRALTRHVGPGASMFVQAVFALHDPAEARALFEEAGFDRIEIETDSIRLRVPPPVRFFREYVRSTPLAMVLADVDEEAMASLEADVTEACRPYVDGDAAVMEPGLLLVTAGADR